MSDKLIKKIESGDDQNTFLHEHVANPVLKLVNALKNMHGKNGIIVTHSDSAIIISYNPKAADQNPNNYNNNISGSNAGTGSAGNTYYYCGNLLV